MPYASKEAKRAQAREWYRKNKKAINARVRERYQLDADFRAASQSRTRAYQRKYRALNPATAKARLDDWRKKNGTRMAAYNRAWRQSNPEKARLNDLRRRLTRDQEKMRAYRASSYMRQSEQLSDAYIRQLIARGRFRQSATPQKLIEAKRAHLKVVRILKEK